MANAKIDQNRKKTLLLVDESTGELFPWACDSVTGEALIEVTITDETTPVGATTKIDGNRTHTAFMQEADTNPIQIGNPIGLLLALTYAVETPNTIADNLYPLICDSNGYLKIDLELV